MSSATTSSYSSSFNNNAPTTRVEKKGNVASVKTTPDGYKTNLTAIDTYGNTFKVPDYTIKDILSAIPSHCYERRLLESFYYVFRDIFMMVTLGYIANNYIELIPNQFVRFATWAGYVWCQGLIATGCLLYTSDAADDVYQV